MPEKQTEKQPEVKKTYVIPFHIRQPQKVGKCGELRFVPRISDQVKIDKETMQVRPVVERYDIQAEVSSHKNECGLEYFKLMLAQGRTTKDASHDDGKHAVDMTLMPETIHDAHAQSVAASDAIASLAKALGVKDDKKLTANDLIDLLQQKVEANIAAKAAAANNGPMEDK